MARIGIEARTAANLGGIRTYARGLISGLEALDSEHEVIVFSGRGVPRGTLTRRFREVGLRTPSQHPLERLALSGELVRHRLDVLHSLDYIPPYHGARRHVITVHDLAFLRFPQFLTHNSRRFYNSQITGAVRRADHILTVSETTRADLIELLGVDAGKISIQVEGVDDDFRPLPAEFKEETLRRIGLPSSYFLFVGTLEPRKNIPGLLEAYRLFRDQVADPPSLVIVGRRGWLIADDLLERPRSGVVWYGEMHRRDLPAAYALATALVMPSFYEGFGLPALEAMACGTVPIVSRGSSLPEVVGDVGEQVDPHDHEAIAATLVHVTRDVGWRNQHEQKALERAARTALRVYDDLARR